jgi:hypothetical protein
MRAILRSIFFTSMFLVLALAVVPVTAQIKPITDCGDLGIKCEKATASSLSSEILKIINAGLILVSITAVIMIVYGGIKYIISMGDDKDTEKAKHIILYAVIGLIVVGLATAIVDFTFGAINDNGGGSNGGGAPNSGDGDININGADHQV